MRLSIKSCTIALALLWGRLRPFGWDHQLDLRFLWLQPVADAELDLSRLPQLPHDSERAHRNRLRPGGRRAGRIFLCVVIQRFQQWFGKALMPSPGELPFQGRCAKDRASQGTADHGASQHAVALVTMGCDRNHSG